MSISILKLKFEKKNQIKKRGFNDSEIDATFAKYDKDGNKNLTEEEQSQMKNDLKQQLNDIDQEIDKFKDDSAPPITPSLMYGFY